MKQEKQFLEVVQLIKRSRMEAYRSVNVELINCYWQVGEYISKRIEAAKWGDKTIGELADYIQIKHPELKNFNRRGLYRMRQFYETYCQSQFVQADSKLIEKYEDTIVSEPRTQFIKKYNVLGGMTDIRGTILGKLNWTNHREIFTRCRSDEERLFYLEQSVKESFSSKELERQISAGLFERVTIGRQNLSMNMKSDRIVDSFVFKDLYVLDFLHLPTDHSESDLQKALILRMKDFILELGKDFTFVGEEFRLQVGNSDFEIDLLFFHRELRCLVAFELKAEKFKPEHLGQLNFYLEALDRDVQKDHENPSIGILLCRDQDAEVVKYAMSRSLSPALVAAYKVQLPDKDVLRQKWKELFEKRE